MQITTQELRSIVPAAFSNAHRMTDRYSQVETYKVVEKLADAGYYPVQAQQDTPRCRDHRFVTHRIVLRHEDHLGAKTVGDQVPQLMLVNSHNGRTKLRMFAGLYRFVCANGLVIGDDMMRFEMQHSGTATEYAMRFAGQMTESLDLLQHTIDRWKAKRLGEMQALEFARKAAELRFGASAKNYAPAALLEARRDADRGDDLWSVFNVVQENTVRGGISGMSQSTQRDTRTRELTAILPSTKFNSDLWRLAEELVAA